ncbi:hypothetical protein Cgig2_018453 [Carnegiea gigantea]|uniref:Uncharacterized protein n=1 Tax=Carnegiea gigantea TaxID=171969 RepID=A0A9Q1K9W4_9CARY|nr:hypothetical protein Cgig2_018453 [Carnegiea gigantea]
MAAVGVAVTVPRSSVSSFPRTFSTIRASFLSPWPSSLGFHSPKLNGSSSNPPRKRLGFVVKAARSESKGVSLGFRAPDFEDGPEFMAEEARVYGYPFPYLYDESQDAARAFGAVCTPEFFLFKKDVRRRFELVYHGQYDDSRPSNNMPVTGRLER